MKQDVEAHIERLKAVDKAHHNFTQGLTFNPLFAKRYSGCRRFGKLAFRTSGINALSSRFAVVEVRDDYIVCSQRNGVIALRFIQGGDSLELSKTSSSLLEEIFEGEFLNCKVRLELKRISANTNQGIKLILRCDGEITAIEGGNAFMATMFDNIVRNGKRIDDVKVASFLKTLDPKQLDITCALMVFLSARTT